MKRATSDPSSRWSRSLRAVGVILALVGAAGVMGGASCSVRSGCDDDDWDDDDDCWDDDDDGWDDDDDGFFSAFQPGGASRSESAIDWTLHDYQRVDAAEPGAAPVAGLLSIRGFSLSSKLGPGVHGDDDVIRFTDRVLHGNDPLFALPADAGQLVFDHLDHQPDFTLAVWRQELAAADGSARRVRDATLTFVLDLHGRLIEVQNLTRHVAPQ